MAHASITSESGAIQREWYRTWKDDNTTAPLIEAASQIVPIARAARIANRPVDAVNTANTIRSWCVNVGEPTMSASCAFAAATLLAPRTAGIFASEVNCAMRYVNEGQL